jgi:hypothetical protein
MSLLIHFFNSQEQQLAVCLIKEISCFMPPFSNTWHLYETIETKITLLMLIEDHLQIGINNVNTNLIYMPNVSAHCIINPYPAISIL